MPLPLLPLPLPLPVSSHFFVFATTKLYIVFLNQLHVPFTRHCLLVDQRRRIHQNLSQIERVSTVQAGWLAAVINPRVSFF